MRSRPGRQPSSPLGNRSTKRICEAVLGVDAERFICVPDGVQHNIIDKTVFSAMVSGLIIKMARDDGSYVVSSGCGIQTPINPLYMSNDKSVDVNSPVSHNNHILQ